ncbi:MAG: Dam family site-specific DNA-(adenine-N6)-methyltransferase [Firmicutes bacterium]|nr:Dam family site-specific DNA-(adenine-N6)-methyltransferase [Bacillota bacterium]
MPGKTQQQDFSTSDDRGQLRPPLKWAGGKRWLVPHLRSLWAEHRHRRLVEPFCGGLAVSLGLLPQRALLNDINVHLINFYTWLQNGLVASLPMKNDEELYYTHRDRFNRLIDANQAHSKTAAELFYYLNRTGYNGLCRFNRKGHFNVPFGRYTRINYIKDFTPYQKVLAHWQFSSVDFARLQLKADDFIYADPPYDVEFTSYAARDFDWSDQVRLARWLSRHPGPVVLSNQATGRIIELYRSLGFELHFLYGPRRISCDGDRTPAKEVLATKNLQG